MVLKTNSDCFQESGIANIRRFTAKPSLATNGWVDEMWNETLMEKRLRGNPVTFLFRIFSIKDRIRNLSCSHIRRGAFPLIRVLRILGNILGPLISNLWGEFCVIRVHSRQIKMYQSSGLSNPAFHGPVGIYFAGWPANRFPPPEQVTVVHSCLFTSINHGARCTHRGYQCILYP
jgi:hypothetical protein